MVSAGTPSAMLPSGASRSVARASSTARVNSDSMTPMRPTGNVANQNVAKDFFDSGEYLRRNGIIPVRTQLVHDMLGSVTDARILDIGCGDGAISRPFLAAGNHVTMLDFSPTMLARARGLAPRAADLALVNCAIEEYIPEAPYDVVLCIGVLAHVASIPDVVGRVAEALKCGGRAVIQITDDASALGWLLNRYGQVRLRSRTLNRMSRHDVAALAATERLSLTDSRRYGLLLPGFGKLPASFEFAMERHIAQSSRHARLGAELLMTFVKG
jgi:2-polyprenyl-3-methyl-5-hydroxy-6-metoxy-1,4-benzoquinol methylase